MLNEVNCGHIGSSRVIWGRLGSSRVISGHIGSYRVVLGRIGSYRVVSGRSGSSQDISGHPGCEKGQMSWKRTSMSSNMSFKVEWIVESFWAIGTFIFLVWWMISSVSIQHSNMFEAFSTDFTFMFPFYIFFLHLCWRSARWEILLASWFHAMSKTMTHSFRWKNIL